MRPLTTIGLAEPLTVAPPGETVTVYEVMDAPPSTTGGVKLTTAIPLPAVAVTPVGAPGGSATNEGVTAFEGLEAGLSPIAFVATTVKVYCCPFVSPVTVSGPAAPDATLPPGEDVTLYSVIGVPPFEDGAVKEIVAWPFPAVAATPVGAPGAVFPGTGVTGADAADGLLEPAAFLALTVKVYVTLFVRPGTVIVVPVPVAEMPSGEDVTV